MYSKAQIFNFFAGEPTAIDNAIEAAWHLATPSTKAMVLHYYHGGSYKEAPSKFFVSEGTYYYRIRNFNAIVRNLATLTPRLAV